MSIPLLQDLTDSDQTITGIPITIKWKIIFFIFSLTFKMNCLKIISQGVVCSADIVTQVGQHWVLDDNHTKLFRRVNLDQKKESPFIHFCMENLSLE